VEICVIDEFGYLMKLVKKGIYPIELWRNENEK